jgi:hypothetical protein
MFGWYSTLDVKVEHLLGSSINNVLHEL